MIASLRGKIGGRTGNSVIVDVNGVGYLAQVGGRTLAALGQAGGDVFLVVETQVREDAIVLIGFPDTEERDVFRMLTSVQGVGARIGLALLSVMTAHEVLAALASGDRQALARADGVGQKLAVRLVTELGGKAAAAVPALGARAAPGDVLLAGRASAANEESARAALLGLGFGKAEVAQYMAAVTADMPAEAGIAQIVQACLRLAGQRAA
jgi:Holliday junction DNA helicase RuvA